MAVLANRTQAQGGRHVIRRTRCDGRLRHRDQRHQPDRDPRTKQKARCRHWCDAGGCDPQEFERCVTSEMNEAGEMLRTGLPPANDRMLTTCFLAALFHAIVILGVTFSSPGSKADGDGAPALEVVLVNDQAPSVARNPNAQYLSERSQKGSGNTLKRERTLIPKSSLMPVERAGIPSGDGLAALQAGIDAADEELVATHMPAQEMLYFASPTAAKEASQLPLLLEKRPDLPMTPNSDGVELRMRGEAMQQLSIAAATL